jgi:hypothetical protein
MLKARVLALCLIVSVSCVPLLAQTSAGKDLLDRIRQEEKDNSQIMKTVHMGKRPVSAGSADVPSAPECKARK